MKLYGRNFGTAWLWSTDPDLFNWTHTIEIDEKEMKKGDSGWEKKPTQT